MNKKTQIKEKKQKNAIFYKKIMLTLNILFYVYIIKHKKRNVGVIMKDLKDIRKNIKYVWISNFVQYGIIIINKCISNNKYY